MTLGTDYTSPRFAYTAMHEFGHALGFTHEHQHPDASIPWDIEKTYPLYRHSVTHYGVANEFTQGAWEQTENTRLSPGDIAFVQQIYPL